MTGIILAGGLSSRIGRDKALLPWGGSIMLKTIVARMREACDDVIVVRNTPLDCEIAGIRIISDIFKQMGPLAGIHAGLTIARYDHAFVTACDMPHLPPEAVKYLLKELPGWDIVIPATDKVYEPLFASYSKRCIPAIEDLLRKDIRKIIEILPFVRYKTIPREVFLEMNPRIFSNINTREDYQTEIQGSGALK